MGETIMRLALLAAIDHPRLWRASPTRIRLATGDVYRVPRHIRQLRIVSGQAWISFAGHDILLAPGQQMTFTTRTPNDIALVSSLDRAPLVFETAKK